MRLFFLFEVGEIHSDAYMMFDGFVELDKPMMLQPTDPVSPKPMMLQPTDPVLPSEAMAQSDAYSIVNDNMTSSEVPDFVNMPFEEFCLKFLSE